MAAKKTIVYLHRYPIEYENVIYPNTRKILDLLLKKYNVVWVSFKTTGKIDKNLRRGLTIRELPYSVDRKSASDKWMKMALWLASIPRIRKIIREEDADLIVHKEQLPFMPYLMSRMKIPLLLDIGDWWWTTLIGGSKLGLKAAQAIENVEVGMWGRSKNMFLTTHSQTEAKVLSERGMDARRIRVVNHPSSDETFKPLDASALRSQLGLQNDFVVTLHGIIHPSKGYDQILGWWADIIKEHPNWKLLILGGTIGEKWCRKKIKDLGIERNAMMTGWLKDEKELNRYLNLGDCLLVTRRNDLANKGLIPSSLFHSLSIGKPVLITGLPGFREMVRDGIDGYSFEPDSFQSFKSKLEYIYSNPEKAKKAGKAGIARGKEMFDPMKSAKGFYHFIDDIIQGRAR